MQNLDLIVDPIIGTLIGFGTNYIAVKMLFRPYKPIKIGKFTLPFTPGVIPKRREKLSESLGDVISKELFTSNDIKEIFLSEKVKSQVVNGISNEIFKDESTIEELILKNTNEEQYIEIKKKVERYIASKIITSLINMDLGGIIARQGANSIKESLRGNFFGKFVSDDLIMQVVSSTGDKVENFLKNSGEEKILPVIDREVEAIAKMKVSEIMEKNNISDDNLKQIIDKAYNKIIEEKMESIFEKFDISSVVQEKINKMDVKEIEKLFMNVMKKELNAIINLGAVLGFLLGVLNIFI